MTNNNQTVTSGGIGLPTILTIVFLILKLTHVINWSWWWVLSPLWISFGLAIVLIIIAILVSAVIAISKR